MTVMSAAAQPIASDHLHMQNENSLSSERNCWTNLPLSLLSDKRDFIDDLFDDWSSTAVGFLQLVSPFSPLLTRFCFFFFTTVSPSWLLAGISLNFIQVSSAMRGKNDQLLNLQSWSKCRFITQPTGRPPHFFYSLWNSLTSVNSCQYDLNFRSRPNSTVAKLKSSQEQR